MALVVETSRDGLFRRTENNPANTWTCKTCFAVVMTGDRTAHKKRHEAEVTKAAEPGGFGS